MEKAMSIEKTIPLMFKARVLSNPDIIAQAAKNEKGAFEYFTYKRLYDDVILFASALKKTRNKERGSYSVYF